MKKHFLLIPTLLAITLAFAACAKKVESVALDQKTITLAVGEKGTLKAIIQPENATNKEITWEIDNPDLAKVSDDGTITANAPGTATITATTKDGGKTTICSLQVIPNVSLDYITLTLNLGGTEILTPTVMPKNAIEGGLVWSSNDESIATVRNDGTVKALAAGSATIVVTALDGGKTASCNLTVVIPVKSVTLDRTALTLDKGTDRTLKATIHPANATDKSLTWSSSDTSVATVGNDGSVRAIKIGKATISVISDDGEKTAKCTLTVRLSDAEWIEEAEFWCGDMLRGFKNARENIRGLSNVYGGQTNYGFCSTAFSTMNQLAVGYDRNAAAMIRSYRMGNVQNMRSMLINYHQMLARVLRDASNEYRRNKSGLAQFGVSGMLVDTVANEFANTAETADGVLLMLR